MNTTATNVLSEAARWSVPLGTALALVIAFAYGTAGLRPIPAVAAQDVVRLDPVVVTISSERFDSIRAQAKNETMLGFATKKAACEG